MEMRGCLFCGERAGAGEHVLPSSLGGLVIDRDLYCSSHERQMSDLVPELARQMEPFSALLGVRSDRKKKLRVAVGKEKGTGQEVSLSVEELSYVRARTVSREEQEGETHIRVHAKSVEDAIREIRRSLKPGEELRVVGEGEIVRFYPDAIVYQPQVGGDSMMAAVAYIALSFLSREYPAFRMDPALDAFKGFPLFVARQCSLPVEERVPHHGGYPIWWDLDMCADLPAPAFPFAHRFVMGYDASDGLLFGRALFFSKIPLSFHFGYAKKGQASTTKVVDVDPLAVRYQDSMRIHVLDGAVARPIRLKGRQRADVQERNDMFLQEAIDSLVDEIQGFQLQRQARKATRLMHIAAKAGREAAVERAREICSDAHQRLLNMARKLPVDAGEDIARTTRLRELIQPIERAPDEPSGLTAEGLTALTAMAEALADQMMADLDAGSLDRTRMEDLLRGEAGKAVLERALADVAAREIRRS